MEQVRAGVRERVLQQATLRVGDDGRVAEAVLVLRAADVDEAQIFRDVLPPGPTALPPARRRRHDEGHVCGLVAGELREQALQLRRREVPLARLVVWRERHREDLVNDPAPPLLPPRQLQRAAQGHQLLGDGPVTDPLRAARGNVVVDLAGAEPREAERDVPAVLVDLKEAHEVAGLLPVEAHRVGGLPSGEDLLLAALQQQLERVAQGLLLRGCVIGISRFALPPPEDRLGGLAVVAAGAALDALAADVDVAVPDPPALCEPHPKTSCAYSSQLAAGTLSRPRAPFPLPAARRRCSYAEAREQPNASDTSFADTNTVIGTTLFSMRMLVEGRKTGFSGDSLNACIAACRAIDQRVPSSAPGEPPYRFDFRSAWMPSTAYRP